MTCRTSSAWVPFARALQCLLSGVPTLQGAGPAQHQVRHEAPFESPRGMAIDHLHCVSSCQSLAELAGSPANAESTSQSTVTGLTSRCLHAAYLGPPAAGTMRCEQRLSNLVLNFPPRANAISCKRRLTSSGSCEMDTLLNPSQAIARSDLSLQWISECDRHNWPGHKSPQGQCSQHGSMSRLSDCIDYGRSEQAAPEQA